MNFRKKTEKLQTSNRIFVRPWGKIKSMIADKRKDTMQEIDKKVQKEILSQAACIAAKVLQE